LLSQECVRSTTQRRALKRAFLLSCCASSPRGRTWSVKPNSCASSFTSSPTYAASKHRFCLCFFVARGFFTTMFSIVGRASFTSCLLAPSARIDRGVPLASTSVLRLVPCFALSVGFFPLFFPTKRRFRHSSIH